MTKKLSRPEQVSKDRRELLDIYERNVALAMLASAVGKIAKQPGKYKTAIDFYKLIEQEQESIKRIIKELEGSEDYPVIRYPREYVRKAVRWAVWERDNFICHYCGSKQNLTIDHKIPAIDGGTNDMENLLTACASCNSRKRTQKYETFIEFILREIADE